MQRKPSSGDSLQVTIDHLGMVITNTIRTLSMDAVQKANSGHPGTPMALAPVAYVLYDKILKYNPANPQWMNRDRFVLSAGHASMLLYSILHITGYDVSLEDLKLFRQLRSKCPGHPEYGLTPGVETTTGPLAQGAATSVGMAMAEKWLAARYNTEEHQLIDYDVYALLSDGCMMEGISGEAASLAGHLGLNNLIWMYDNNRITIEGNTALAFSEDVAERFMAYKWNVLRVSNANDVEMLEQALQLAKCEAKRPTLIIVDSHIAYGSPNKQDTSGAHGSPLGEDEIRATKEYYGWDPDKKFYIPDEINEYRESRLRIGNELESSWNAMFEQYKETHPEFADEISMILRGEMPADWNCCLPSFDADEKGLATRSSNHVVLNQLASNTPWFMGGSADLTPSTLTNIKAEEDFSKDNYSGRNLHFGIREHAMGAIANGLALSGLRPYVSTFMVFSDFLRPSLRLSALMEQPVIYIFTHDSIGVGEDGPTHQPVEHIASMRAIPNLEVIRPADANEVSVLWHHIMDLKQRPVALVLTRQNVPTFDRTKYASAEGALFGAYIMADCEGPPEVILIATGSEVQLCIDAYEQLKTEGFKARVVSMPCWSLFESQDADYKERVLPKAITARVSVEAGSTFGWRRYAGRHDIGRTIGLRDFGASAPIKDLLEEFGLTVDGIVRVAKDTINRKDRKE
jgi:transketolase